ncbi:AsmA family protein [Seohaeicola zhoushanensis]|uniref:Cell envelope biogenesis protein AsmA n=1 Tax=Seohaeicola zhoushanensis TaxID=1569283 RepID=A0A8J3GXS1_9RHOB|nr:AsmA family protein [Seohaeicola zhoushanensis]GHF48609.1 cell envelope biogenesis protein AsmA [Seohaeicola zhoushanensis]
MRWVFRIIGALALCAVLLVGGIFLLPGEKIASLAAEQIRAQTGRVVTISGDVRFSIWPVLGVRTGPVTVANADWAGPEPIFAAQSMSVGVAAADLLAGSIRITEIVAEGAHLRLARWRDGRGNWEMVQPVPTPRETGTGGTTRPVTLERLVLTGARLDWSDAGAAPLTLAGIDLTLDWPDPTRAADISVSMSPAGEPVRANLSIGAFRAFLAGEVTPISAQLEAPGGTASFEGRANTAGALAGDVSLKTTDTARMLAAAGLGRVDIPSGAGQMAHVATEATYTADGRLSLRKLSLTLDQNRLTGAADIDLSGKPKIVAQLSAGTLDLTGLGGTAASGGGAAAASEGWSTAPIDASALGLLDGTIDLTADTIRTLMTEFGRAELRLTIDNARAVADIARLDAFSGTLTGQFVANNRRGLSVGGKLNADGIEMSRALKDLADIERFSGKANAVVEFLGGGTSEAEIMRSLSGSGGLAMGQGVIAGVDLNALMTLGKGSGGTTVFDSLAATFTMAGGNLQNDDLVLSLPNYRAEGKGRIGLGARDIDYLFTPIALRARGGEGLAVPILIRGPWSGPQIKPDLEGVLKAKADTRTDELKEKAKAKLSERLGVPVESSQDAKDALKDKLEEEAKKGLLKLFNKN